MIRHSLCTPEAFEWPTDKCSLLNSSKRVFSSSPLLAKTRSNRDPEDMEHCSGVLDLIPPSLPDRPGIHAFLPNNTPDLLFRGNAFQTKNHDDPLTILYTPSQPIPSTKAPSTCYYAEYPASNPSSSRGRHYPVPIAIHPDKLRQMNALKRSRDEEDYSDHGDRKRRRLPLPSSPFELNKDEQLLLKLKDEENLPWKEICDRFWTDLGKSYRVPALQMRLKRLRKRMETWAERDASVKPCLNMQTRKESPL